MGVVMYLSFLVQYSLLELRKTIEITIDRSPEALILHAEAADLYASVFRLPCVGGHVVR